jgi:catechol 2,3-dioxygenase-like lactoylglutathione lyase family enzyme
MGLLVADRDASVAFYTRALALLDYELVMRREQFAGFGVCRQAGFWIATGRPTDKIARACNAGPRRATTAAMEARDRDRVASPSPTSTHSIEAPCKVHARESHWPYCRRYR